MSRKYKIKEIESRMSMNETTAEYQVKNRNRKMNNKTRNEMARHSLGILKLAVLDVLYQQRKCQRYSDHNSVQLMTRFGPSNSTGIKHPNAVQGRL